MHPKLGMEIEANWPPQMSLNSELQAQLVQARAAVPAGITQPSAAYGHEGDNACYSAFISCSHAEGRPPSENPDSSPNVFLRKFFEFVDPKFWFPKNWDKGHDSGVEGRYASPAESLAQAEEWTKNYAAWLRLFGFTQFSSAGTHVHVGHLAWLDEKFGANLNNPVRNRAEALMWAYFATREAGIFGVTPKHRVTCGSCPPIFMGRSGHTPNVLLSQIYTSAYLNWGTGRQVFTTATPAWAFHNHIVMNWSSRAGAIAGFDGGSIQNRRKDLPTLEFRFFAGTHATTALVGYLRLLHDMFLRATKVVTEENVRAKDETSLNDGIVVNPYTYTVGELLNETQDPWLKEWISRTVKNKGEPLTDEITISPSLPQAVAAAA